MPDFGNLVNSPDIIPVLDIVKNDEIIMSPDQVIIYTGGGDDLSVDWVPRGQRFEIHEYDGNESIRLIGPNTGFVA